MFAHYEDMEQNANVEIGMVSDGQGSPKIIRNMTIRWSAYDFLFDYKRNCVSISYSLQVIVNLFDKSRRFKPGLPQGGISGPDEHSEQVTGNSQVAGHFEPSGGGSTPGSVVEASTYGLPSTRSCRISPSHELNAQQSEGRPSKGVDQWRPVR